MEKTGKIFAVSKAMGHGRIQSMKPYQHPNDYRNYKGREPARSGSGLSGRTDKNKMDR